MYMQQRTGSFKEAFSKNTFYRFLNSSKQTGFVFTSLLAADIVNHDIRDLTDPERKMSLSLMTAFSTVPAVRKRNWDQKVLTTRICISKGLQDAYFKLE